MKFIIQIFLSLYLLSDSSFAFERILIIGDSLSAGYGLSKNQAYPKLAEEILRKTHPQLRIYNGSVSGSTTSSLMSRLKWFNKVNPELVIFALGANDGLRGIDTNLIKSNLNKGISSALKSKRKVLLIGMMVPPNYGKQYSQAYVSIFNSLVKKHRIPFIPFLLEGIAGKKELNQVDGIHPNEKGHRMMAEMLVKKITEIQSAKY